MLKRSFCTDVYTRCLADTKQKAFIQALTAASIVHRVTSACSSGVLDECKCDDFKPANRLMLMEVS